MLSDILSRSEPNPRGSVSKSNWESSIPPSSFVSEEQGVPDPNKARFGLTRPIPFRSLSLSRARASAPAPHHQR